MDFNEPVISQQQISTDDSEKKTENNIPVMSRLENDIDEVYSQIESKFSTFWNSASRSIQGSQGKSISPQQAGDKNGLPTEENTTSDASESSKGTSNLSDAKLDLAAISISANRALDELDSKLEIVEQQAGNFVNSITSFFSSSAVAKPRTTPSRKVHDSSPLPIIPGDAYGSSRFDMELFKLHTTEKIFLDHDTDDEIEISKFVVDDKTQEISTLLLTYPETLEILMKKLVPTQLTYKEFWFKYFKQESKLKAGEKARKELLSRNTGDTGSIVKQDSELRKGVDAEGHSQFGEQNEAKKSVKAGDKVEDLPKKEEEEEEEEEEEFLWDDEDDLENSDA